MVTDSCFQVCFVATFKEKAEAFVYLTCFVNGIKYQYSIDVKVICLNRGTEFGGQKLIDFA
jgi:hypothetical protein